MWLESASSAVHAHRAATVLSERHDAVTPGALGAVERLVGGLEHLVGAAVLGQALGGTDADGHRHAAGPGRPPQKKIRAL